MLWTHLLLLLALLLSYDSCMQPGGGINGAFLAGQSLSTSSLDSIDSLADCTDDQRDELLLIIDDPLGHVLQKAIDAILNDNQYHNDKFRQYFFSLYSEHKRDVETWFYRVLYQIRAAQTARFKIQCHGDEELQCPPDVFAVTDFSKKGIILCSAFWNELPTITVNENPVDRAILRAREYTVLLLLLSIFRERDSLEPEVSIFPTNDRATPGFRRTQTPWQAIQDAYNLVHFARDIVIGAAAQNLRPPAPYVVPQDAEIVPRNYIVFLAQTHNLGNHIRWMDIDITRRQFMFRSLRSINAYHAELSEDLVRNLIRYDPGVSQVEPDIYVRPELGQEPRSVEREPAVSRQNVRKWTKRPGFTMKWWNKMIVASRRITNWTFYSGSYLSYSGKGVRVYVFDTGVRITHQNLRRRATHFQGHQNSPYFMHPVPMTDSFGHGTHVAGIILHNARASEIVNVKVWENAGTATTHALLAQALDDVIFEHNRNRRSNPPGWRGSIINMSFSLRGAPSLTAFARNVEAAYRAGIPIAVSAGNQNTASVRAPCVYSPYVVCVAACNKDYRRWVSSNYGRYVTIFSPGEGIWSSYYASDTSMVSMTGTSQASPAVAAVMAIRVSYEKITDRVTRVLALLDRNQLADVIDVPPNTDTTRNLINTGLNKPGTLFPPRPYAGAPAAAAV